MDDRTPSEVLEQNVVLNTEQLAFVCNLLVLGGVHKGQPDRRAALELIRAGKLPIVDRDQPVRRWTVPVPAVRRYLAGGDTAVAS